MVFSVIVPIYNVEQYLDKCLNSILEQTFADYEVIAIDDGATDGSLEILKKYKERDKRVKIIRQENKGLGGARNSGINSAQGDYLFFLDSDDYIPSNALQKLYDCIAVNNVDILAFDSTRVAENGKVIEQSTKPYNSGFTELTKKELMLFEPSFCFKLYKRKLFQSTQIRFPEHLWYEDLATFYRLIPSAEKIGYLKENLYYYVQQGGSITHSLNRNRMQEIMTAYDITLQFYVLNGYFDEFRDELEWLCALHVLYYSAFRIFSCGYYPNEMKTLWNYADSKFSDIQNSIMIMEKAEKTYHMRYVLRKQYLRFYYKTFIKPAILICMKKLYLKIRKE
ncbi:MAG: glycosyltransferase family 2 protein [Eubacteriales bacterium]|nr:glycosyltransferase family 2 protein [Eubacteriales bacterium]